MTTNVARDEYFSSTRALEPAHWRVQMTQLCLKSNASPFLPALWILWSVMRGKYPKSHQVFGVGRLSDCLTFRLTRAIAAEPQILTALESMSEIPQLEYICLNSHIFQRTKDHFQTFDSSPCGVQLLWTFCTCMHWNKSLPYKIACYCYTCYMYCAIHNLLLSVFVCWKWLDVSRVSGLLSLNLSPQPPMPEGLENCFKGGFK